MCTKMNEADFWSVHDSTEFVDWSKAVRAEFPKLHPSLQSISLRLSEPMLARLKTLANERDVPYQSFIKMILADYIKKGLSRQMKSEG